MKIVFLILSFLLSSPVRGAADDLAMAATVPDQTTHIVLLGVVKSVSNADPVKGTASEIVVIDSSRKINRILVTSTTTLWDDQAKAIMSDKIVPRRHVKVVYETSPEGVNIAQSIKLLK